jgi:glutamate N-acetyltransferase/amino-acid N-acetyltransferase
MEFFYSSGVGLMMERFICKGFRAAGVAAGIKTRSAMDLGLIVSDEPAAVAGVFTRNKVQAAPVQLCRQRISTGRCQAVIVNSGNANCAAGEAGMAAARAMTTAAADGLGIAEQLVLVASTGVIGRPLPVAAVEAAMGGLTRALRPDGFGDLARAIMTTDTEPKLSWRTGDIDGRPFSIVVVAKGAGMIRPDMATLLLFACTDAEIPSGSLQEMLQRSTDVSLNRITIDGDTSTNDTALLLANGLSGAVVRSDLHRQMFQSLLDDIFMELARWLVRDGEGVTKVVEIGVRGAESHADARRIADAIAHSPLVKTAFFGEDANWGRILGAAGRAGVPLDPERVDLYFDQIQMVKGGAGRGDRIEAEASKVLKLPEFSVTIDLNLGQGEASLLTCDFSVDYVRINADYRT